MPKTYGQEMDNIGPKPIGLTPLEKCQYLDFLKFLFFLNLERRFFVLEYHKPHFSGLHCLKKCGAKMANFGQKPWINNLTEKLSIFRLFKLVVFIA